MTDTIEDLLKNVPFRYIYVYRIKGKKHTTGDHSNYTIEQIESDKGDKRKSNYKSYYLKHSDVFCIDVDQKPIPTIVHELIEQYKIPYTETINGYHLYVESNIKEFKNSVDVFKDFKGDLIHFTMNIWELHNRIVYNGIVIPRIHYDELAHLLKIEVMHFTHNNIANVKTNLHNAISVNNDPNIIHDLSHIKELIGKLSIDRAIHRKKWVAVGMALKNISKGKQEIDFLNLWVDFSKKIPEKFDYEMCITQWNSFNNDGNGYGFDSLIKWVEYDTNKNIPKIVNLVTVFEEGHIQAAAFVYSKKGSDVIFAKGTFFTFDDETLLWISIMENQLMTIIAEFILQEMTDIIKNEKNTTEETNLRKLLKKYVNPKFVSDLCKYLKGTIQKNDMFDKMDNNRETINFKNVVYNLKTGEVRKRFRKDYVSKCLNYDFDNVTNKDVNDEIRKMIFDISNNDDELFQFNLKWLGYCLTGETSLQKMLFVIGYSAQNGKSSLARMYHYSLPIYSAELDNKTFNENYSKVHKQLANIQKPIRFCIIEELSHKNLDASLFKKFVDGNEITNEVLYSTTENIYNHSKLYVTSNTDPKFFTDSGIKRRGIMEVLNNKFVDINDYNKLDNKNGFFIKDNGFNNKFNNNIYKLEFVRILIHYAKLFYDDGLKIPDNLTYNFHEVCEENDNIKYFTDKYYDITNNDDDRIHRDAFIDLYNTINKTKLKWNDISSDVKRIGLIYNRQKRADGLKGAICGLKLKNDDVQNNLDE